MPIERKLAAIMFTDIAGYTAQMSKDEDKAIALIKKEKGCIAPAYSNNPTLLLMDVCTLSVLIKKEICYVK